MTRKGSLLMGQLGVQLTPSADSRQLVGLAPMPGI